MTDARCCFCGSYEGFEHRRRPFDWQDVDGSPCCDAECARLHRLRLDAVPLEDVALEFEVPSPGDGWRVIDRWWLVSDTAYVILELDAVVGAGWYVMPRGGGIRGPMADWREAVG
jgi:hypothetical protein